MEFPLPVEGIFTIYSKSGCPNCVKVKQLLKEKQQTFYVIDCDEFILENKVEFLDFMKTLTGIECKMFPMIFNDGQYITNTNKFIEELKTEILDFNQEF